MASEKEPVDSSKDKDDELEKDKSKEPASNKDGDKADAPEPDSPKEQESQADQDKSDSDSEQIDTTGNVDVRSHANRLLDTILDEPPPPSRHFRHHMAYDLLLAVGLLVAVGGFTTGMMRIYITHMAKQSITQGNYKAAINILKKNPVPEFFSSSATAEDAPDELLNRALFLDAMDKLDNDQSDAAALKQLERITAGSQFFNVAQEILKARSPSSQLQLEGGTVRFAKPKDVKEPDNEKLFNADAN